MGRAHTRENVAPAIAVLRHQFDEVYPNRDKSSDGIWPSAAHSKANPKSDHEWGNALDIDDDLSGKDGHGASVSAEMAARLSADPRCKYTIHAGRIYKNGRGKKYSGSNRHDTHIHISVYESKRRGNAPWNIEDADVRMIVKTIGARKYHYWASRVVFKLDIGSNVYVIGKASNGWLCVKTISGLRGWVPPYAVK